MSSSEGAPEELRPETSDGVRLSLRRYAAAGPPALLAHAMMANGSVFERKGRGLAPWLAARGLDAYVLDFRGHGRSVPPDPRRDSWTFDDYVLRDLPAALGAIAAARGSAEGLRYLGHSLGGLVGAARAGAAEGPPFARMVLMTANYWNLRDCEGLAEKLRRAAVMAGYRAVALPLGYAPIRRFGAGTDDEPGSYVRALTGWFFRSRWTGADGAVDYEAGLARIRVPVLALASEGDPLCLPRDKAKVLARMPNAPARLRVVGAARGDAGNPDHFGVLVDPRYEPLWEEIAAFLLEENAADGP